MAAEWDSLLPSWHSSLIMISLLRRISIVIILCCCLSNKSPPVCFEFHTPLNYDFLYLLYFYFNFRINLAFKRIKFGFILDLKSKIGF